MLFYVLEKDVLLVISALLSIFIILFFSKVKNVYNNSNESALMIKTAFSYPYRRFKSIIKDKFKFSSFFMLSLIAVFMVAAFYFIKIKLGLTLAIMLFIPVAVAVTFAFLEIIWLSAFIIGKIIALENTRMNTIFSLNILMLLLVFTDVYINGSRIDNMLSFCLAIYNLIFCYIMTIFLLLLLLREANSSRRVLTFRNLWKSTFLIILLFLIILSALSYVAFIYNPNSFSGESISSFFDLFYYTCVTFATVGFGDITPNTTITRGISILTIITSIICITILLSTVMSVRKNENK
ncbi:MAG: ion channel [Acutalibacteraceae bacterium]